MEPGDSLSHSLKPVTEPYPELVKSIYALKFYLYEEHFNIIFLSVISLTGGIFYLGVSIKILYTLLGTCGLSRHIPLKIG